MPDFLDKIKDSLEDAVSLKITTVVGEVKRDANGAVSNPLGYADDAKIMYSCVNLLDGDLTTVMDPAFVDGDLSSIRGYHQSREQAGRAIIDSNIQAIKSLVDLAKSLNGDNSQKES